MRKITIPRRYRTILTKSTVSQFHLMLKLKDSFSRAAIKIVAYSINAMNMKNSETNAKTVIPVIDSESGRIFCMSLKRREFFDAFVFIFGHHIRWWILYFLVGQNFGKNQQSQRNLLYFLIRHNYCIVLWYNWFLTKTLTSFESQGRNSITELKLPFTNVHISETPTFDHFHLNQK